MFTEYSLCVSFSFRLPFIAVQPDRNILSLSEEMSFSCVLPLIEVCHRLEMQPFDVGRCGDWGGDLGANTDKHAH